MVRGVVLEEGTGTPIEGAMVVVLDAGGHAVARTLTDATGAFLVQLEGTGGYRVRIDRIGYESLTTDAFDVTAAGVFRRISVPVHAIQLKGLDVSGARRCEVRPEVGRATAVV